uniref:Uncharacterized protein n=1 Tax=Populus trichocarpa TaxID=3694 RepID=A0A3N7FUJ8_POPTR
MRSQRWSRITENLLGGSTLVELLLWLTWPFGACLHPWSLQEVLHWIEEVTEHNKEKTSKHSMRRGECSFCSLFKIESPNTLEQKFRMLLRRSYYIITNHILKNQYSTSFLLLKFHFHS